MSEKRFKLKENLEDVLIEDTITQSQYSIYGIVDVLNEQDDELHKYRTENAELLITILENEKEIDEQQATIEEYKDFCLNLCKFVIQKGLVDEYREKYGKEYKIITKWWNND